MSEGRNIVVGRPPGGEEGGNFLDCSLLTSARMVLCSLCVWIERSTTSSRKLLVRAALI
mgnify:CR=1 FL=1